MIMEIIIGNYMTAYSTFDFVELNEVETRTIGYLKFGTFVSDPRRNNAWKNFIYT